VVSCAFSLAADDSAQHNRGCALPGTGPGKDGQDPAGRFAVDAAALVLAWRLGLAVAEVPVRVSGGAVRVLVDGRRVLTQAGRSGERWAGGQRPHRPPRLPGAIQQGSP
jgi:hypothetical protein